MANVRIDDAALQAFIHDPDGPIRNELRRRARRVKFRARQLVGVETGALRASIHVTDIHGRTVPTVSIRSNLPYALLHHTGSRPHVIRPNSERFLRFKVAGKTVYVRHVQHPGSKPNPFLARALREAAGN